MRGTSPTPDASMRFKQFGLVELLGWRGYLECPAPIADDFAVIIEEKARQQAEELDRMKRETAGKNRR